MIACLIAMVGLGSMPQQGLAGRYAGDFGIEKDPGVLLHEDFESGTIDDLKKRWDDVSNKDGSVLSFSTDTPNPKSEIRNPKSGRSLKMTATLGHDTGGHLYTRLPKAVDQVYTRFYVKFEKDPEYIHHFVHLGGYRPATPWAQGGAGTRPNGDERITVGIEPHGDYGRYKPPGTWSFYAYWQEMKISADGKYWGNAIRPEQPAFVPKDSWQCVEVMLKLNSAPDKADGELALWLDGKPVMDVKHGTKRALWSGMGFTLKADGEPFEGFRFRRTNDLKINFVWLLYYVTEDTITRSGVKSPKQVQSVWFDDIVVATQYIGPKRATS